MVSMMRPLYVTFPDPPPDAGLRLTAGRIYDVLAVQIGVRPAGEREVWLVIEDDDGTVDMLPARLCEILDVGQLG